MKEKQKKVREILGKDQAAPPLTTNANRAGRIQVQHVSDSLYQDEEDMELGSVKGRNDALEESMRPLNEGDEGEVTPGPELHSQ